MPIDRFSQQRSEVPEFLRYGTITRGLAMMTSSAREELDPDDAALHLVRPGYFDAGSCIAILESAGISQERARQAVERQWSRYRDVLAAAPGSGDWERFDAACDAISAQGILVRQNFTCCRTCADDEIDAERSRENPEWGYVFFTQIDGLDLAHMSASVWLGYGSFGPSPRITATELQGAQGNDALLSALYERTFDHLAEVVTGALTENGLRYDWDGDTESRIQVVEMDWRRPLPSESTVRPQPAPPAKQQKFGFGFQ